MNVPQPRDPGDPADPTSLPIFQAEPGDVVSGDRAPSGDQVATHRDSEEHPRSAAHLLAGRHDAMNAPAVEAAHSGPDPRPGPPTPTEPPPPSVRSGSRHGGAHPGVLDWQLVAELRSQASDLLMAALGDERGQDGAAERERGRAIIHELLASTAADRIHDGEPAWTLETQARLAEAVFNALFGLGRLQPYVDDDSVENIIITGADTVFLEKTDGDLVRVEPVADSDAELLEFLQFVSARQESTARSFSAASPTMHMRLDGGPRLAAAAWVTAFPVVVIRRHRLVRVTLDDLVGRDMLTPVQASFLSAAVKAGLSIVVAGPQGAGKTTMVRALCAEIPRHEKLGTFETEFELHLHELKDVHPIVIPFEARPGSGEVGPDGRRAGEYTLDEGLRDSFRMALSRQIVGEVRGSEVWAMLKAMESGAGSISTTHAADGEAAMRKLVTCGMEAGQGKEVVTAKLAEAVDLIVQVHLETVEVGPDRWHRTRWVSEILHVTPGEEAKGYATTHVYVPHPDGGPAQPGTLPDELRRLERHGFDLAGYLAAAPGSGPADPRRGREAA